MFKMVAVATIFAFESGIVLAIFYLQVAPIFPTKFGVSSA